MFKRILISFLILFCLGTGAQATHIVGGELYYSYLGGSSYLIRLTVYRDCFNGVPPFDPLAMIGIWDANNNFLQYIEIPPNDSADIPNIINSPCFVPPVDVCYRVCNYYATISLPARVGGYQLAYQRCCRNQTILNIVNPLATGATFYAHIPDPGTQLFYQNSNPVFTELPPPFICSGLAFEFDHSAIDAEGDSLVYELCQPFHGGDNGSNPVLTPTTVSSFPPPYTPVIFQSSFNLGNLIGGTVPLAIDPQTGLLTATPSTIGQFVIGVCVNEYRNGVLLSKTRRDYQLNVVPCPTLVVAAIQAPNILCGTNTVNFQNNSFGAGSYSWNFGDPTTANDTTTIVSPQYTYPDTGLYFITLIAYSVFNPSCADTTVDTVHVLPDYIADFNFNDSACSYTVSFNDTSNTDSGPTVGWLWNFGDGTSFVNTADPIHTFPGPGTYTVTLNVASSEGCRETISKTVVIDPVLTVSATNGHTTCHGLCTGQSTANVTLGTSPYQFIWSDSLNQSTQTATGLCPGTYTVIVQDSNGCADTATAIITEPDSLASIMASTDAYCEGMCIGTASVSVTGGTQPYTVQWDDPQAQTGLTASGLCPGWYSASIIDANGCTIGTDSIEVIYSTFIPPLDAIISDDTIFTGQQVFLSAIPGGNFTYSWTPVSWLSSSTIANPTASPLVNMTYYVTITDPFGCSNLDSVYVVVREVTCTEPEIFIPNAFSPNGDRNNDLVYVRGNTIRDLEFRIYNRWGEKVFETNDPALGWDGTFKGKEATPAVYVYYLEATCFDEQHFFKKGNITLIR